MDNKEQGIGWMAYSWVAITWWWVYDTWDRQIFPGFYIAVCLAVCLTVRAGVILWGQYVRRYRSY